MKVVLRFGREAFGEGAGEMFSLVVADVWEKDVWEFQAKSGSSGSCRLFLHFLEKIAVQEMSGKTPGSPRHPSSRHPWPSDFLFGEVWSHFHMACCCEIQSFFSVEFISRRPIFQFGAPFRENSKIIYLMCHQVRF